jgi:hypothetical protein
VISVYRRQEGWNQAEKLCGQLASLEQELSNSCLTLLTESSRLIWTAAAIAVAVPVAVIPVVVLALSTTFLGILNLVFHVY